MKTIQIKLYSFNELSKDAQETAIENVRENITDYYHDRDALNSLKEFAKHFNSELKGWEIDFFNTSFSSVKFAEVEEMEESELKELIMQMGEFNPETLKGLGDCKFTGVCFDEDAADGARKAFFAGERDVNEILQAGFNTWLKSVHADTDFLTSDEGIKEEIEANEYDFTEDGEQY